jgi:DNA polymerase III subunit chi
MALVDFYLIQETQINEAYRFICRLLDKAYQQKNRIYVHANSLDEAKTLDDLLWTFRDDGFIPHEIYEGKPASSPLVLIQIGYKTAPANEQDILINLTETVPDFFPQFQRVLEIVPNNENAKKISRSKFRIYRGKNCELNTHALVNA